MRRMSFALTTDQVRDRTKTVTRRKASTWSDLQPGDRVLAVTKVMGFRKGERAEVLGELEVIGVRVEPLSAITFADCAREGFPEFGPADFIAMVRGKVGIKPEDQVRRIEFRYVVSELAYSEEK